MERASRLKNAIPFARFRKKKKRKEMSFDYLSRFLLNLSFFHTDKQTYNFADARNEICINAKII